ncbi:hypothetical protein [Rhizobium sp. RCC_161_2]
MTSPSCGMVSSSRQALRATTPKPS